MLNKLLLILALLTGLYGAHEWDKSKAVRQAVVVTETRLNASYALSQKKADELAAKRAESLQKHADFVRNTKDETIQTITRERDIAISELRNRPKRPSPSNPTPNPSSGQACTARELYQEDAEFLTREAARAESVLVERDYYYEQYEKVRNEFNGTPK